MSRKLLFLLALPLALLYLAAGTASAAQTTYQFQGTTASTMTVNNGTSTGSIPAGTPYSGTLNLDEPQTATPVAFGGGTHTSYAYTSMTLTVGATTISWGPGRIDVYDNLSSTSSGYPIGDSVYANINGVAPSGTINGAQFNWIFLGLVDYSGTAVSGGVLPANLDITGFNSAFIEFNYGTLGTPWGAGNTSTLQFLSGLSRAGGAAPSPTPSPSPTPAPLSFAPSLANGALSVPYSSTFAPASGGSGSFTYTASGLPAGLSLSGATVSGIPQTVGTFTVTLTATDSAGASIDAQASLVIASGGNYTQKDEGKGKITAIDPDYQYVIVGSRKILINGGTDLTVNTPDGEAHVLDSFVQVGMKVQWKGLRDKATNTVLASKVEIN